MAVSATFNPVLRVIETLTALNGANSPGPTFDTANLAATISGTIDATTSVAATKVISAQVSLSAGAASMDLISNTYGWGGAAVTFSGLKVQLAFFQNLSTNTAAVTIADGATNGLNIFGDSSGQITLGIGAWAFFYNADRLDDVGASDKTIDFSSSDVDAAVNVILVAG